MIDAIPPFAIQETTNGDDIELSIESNEPQWNKDNRHEVEIQINRDGTYQIKVEAKDGSKEARTISGTIADHFGLRGDKYTEEVTDGANSLKEPQAIPYEQLQ